MSGYGRYFWAGCANLSRTVAHGNPELRLNHETLGSREEHDEPVDDEFRSTVTWWKNRSID